jgi:hypothetical protein
MKTNEREILDLGVLRITILEADAHLDIFSLEELRTNSRRAEQIGPHLIGVLRTAKPVEQRAFHRAWRSRLGHELLDGTPVEEQ